MFMKFMEGWSRPCEWGVTRIDRLDFGAICFLTYSFIITHRLQR